MSLKLRFFSSFLEKCPLKKIPGKKNTWTSASDRRARHAWSIDVATSTALNRPRKTQSWRWWCWKQIHHGLKCWELNRSFTIFFWKKLVAGLLFFVRLSESCVIECVNWLCRMGWIILYIDILAICIYIYICRNTIAFYNIDIYIYRYYSYICIIYTCYILCRNERTFIFKQCWTWRCWNHVSIDPPKKSGYQQILNLNRYPPGIKHGSWNLLNIFSS